MKAIKINENTKQLGAIDSIYSGSIPKTLVRGNDTVLGYDKREDLQALDGWQDVINPVYNSDTQRLGKVIESATGFTREVIDYTPEEIESNNQIVMPRNDFKLALLEKHGITNSHVDALFQSLLDANAVPVIEVEKMKILWYESTNFRSTTPELFQFAYMMDSIAGIDLSQDDLKQIFIDYANGI